MIADLPPADSHPHGTRARYVAAKCRCGACREANTLYARKRAALAKAHASELPAAGDSTPRTCPGVNGSCQWQTKLYRISIGGVCERCRPLLVWNGLVPATAARDHLRNLSRQGVGLDAVHEASDVARSVLGDIHIGRKTKIRRQTEAKILAVDEGARLGGSVVDATETRRMILALLDAGFTKAALSQRLGATTPALQLGRAGRVTAITALKVARLYRMLDVDAPDVEVPDNTTYVRNLITNAVRATPLDVTQLLGVVRDDYGTVTVRTMHRYLAALVADGVLQRTTQGDDAKCIRYLVQHPSPRRSL